MAITPLRESNSQTNPMRRMFSSRSSRLKPSPLDKCVRTTSPSSNSTFAPAAHKRRYSKVEMVLLPAPERPVNQTVQPLCILQDTPPGVCLLGGADRVDLDRLCFSVERSRNNHLLPSEPFGRLLIAERMNFLAIVENVERAVRQYAGDRAFCVRRPHPHTGVVRRGAHAVGDRTRELLFVRSGYQRRDRKERKDAGSRSQHEETTYSPGTIRCAVVVPAFMIQTPPCWPFSGNPSVLPVAPGTAMVM